MGISRILLVSITIRFFRENDYSYYWISQKTDIDQKTIKAWAGQKPKQIRDASFHTFFSKLNGSIKPMQEKFWEFLLEELKKAGINTGVVRSQIDLDQDITISINGILRSDITKPKLMQEEIGTLEIIRTLKELFSPYRDFFQVNDKYIVDSGIVPATTTVFNPDIEQKEKPFIDPEINYIILKFPSAYNVGILLSNYLEELASFNPNNYFLYIIEKNIIYPYDLKMLLIVTDQKRDIIPINVQAKLMESHNLFFEFVRREDIDGISIKGLNISSIEPMSISKTIDIHRYAQLIFEQFMSYLAVIGNEILFFPYLEKIRRELNSTDTNKATEVLNSILISYNKRSNYNNFVHYSKEILLKSICNYSYLARHTIYHERTLIKETVEKLLNEKGCQKIPLAVEICAPNSLTTVNVIPKIDKLYLFTASHTAYMLMKEIENKSEGHFFPENVELQLCHLNPEFMTYEFPDILNGSVDLLVIGFGAGSQISDLTRFIRYAYNWLTDNGMIFISVYNRDSIVLNKYHIKDERFQIFPLYTSDYWVHTYIEDKDPLLKNIKAYSPESFHTAYMSLFDTEDGDLSTYPYVSALVNPQDYTREILDEIRLADKLFSSQGRHGQLINAIGRKKKDLIASINKDKVLSYLKNGGIDYQLITHTLSPDSRSLCRSLNNQNIMKTDTILLKAVILQEISNKTQWLYAVLPYDKKVVFDYSKYELVPETTVIKKFDQGPISPLVIISMIEMNKHLENSFYLLYSDRIKTKYVIMGSGSNYESIKIETNKFLELLKGIGVKKQNIIE